MQIKLCFFICHIFELLLTSKEEITQQEMGSTMSFTPNQCRMI